MGMSISLIWNGTPVFWRFDTIHDAPFISTMLSVVRFLMSVNRYLAIVVRRGDDVFQRYGVYPHGRLRQPDLVSQVQAVVTDEILRQFVHRHVRPLVLPLNKLRYVFADGQVFLVRTLGAVFAHPLGKRLILLVKGS